MYFVYDNIEITLNFREDESFIKAGGKLYKSWLPYEEMPDYLSQYFKAFIPAKKCENKDTLKENKKVIRIADKIFIELERTARFYKMVQKILESLPFYLDSYEYVGHVIEPDNNANNFIYNGGRFDLSIRFNGVDICLSFGTSQGGGLGWEALGTKSSIHYNFSEEGLREMLVDLLDFLKKQNNNN